MSVCSQKLPPFNETISALENEVADLKADNDTALKRVETSINLNEIKDIAIRSLGMSYAGPDQVAYYRVEDADYMNQYEDIPKSSVVENGRQDGGKEMAKFRKKMRKKLVVLFLMIAILLVGLIVRMMYIEHTSGKKYEKIVLSQQKYDSTVIPYQRGNIVDCKGTILATSVDVYNVILDCKVLNSEAEY